jgi:hypothetical protein
METDNNYILKQKIDLIDTLPINYEPNLESKWELMEASLKPHKRKSFLYIFNRIAGIAALLLLLGGISIYGIKSIKNQHENTKIITAKKSVLPSKNYAFIPKLTNNKSKKIKTTRLFVKSKLVKTNNTLLEVKNQFMDTKILDTNERLVIVIPEKQKRFTEIDFGEPTLSAQNGITIPNNPNLKFKIGGFDQTNLTTFAQNKPTFLGISKQIN